MHKYQIAVKSSMDSYVRNASLDEPEVKTDQPLKRKWEDSGGADSVVSPTAEKKLKKYFSFCHTFYLFIFFF